MSHEETIPQPVALGLNPSFGFGDRLGLAGPGHIRACRKGGLAPILAQQSIRELDRTHRTPGEVMQAARDAVRAEGWTAPWGADADHLKTREDVQLMADNGFVLFTIDPSAHVNNEADRMDGGALDDAVEALVGQGVYASPAELEALYLNRSYELADDQALVFDDRTALQRAAVKYGAAMAYSAKMAAWIDQATGERPHEIEMSVDETDNPTSPLEHLFIGLELQRRRVRVTSLAPRFCGEFEKGIDYKGDIERFERELRVHHAIAQRCGPYKISVHSGSDKFTIYPVIGRVCGDLLHVKTAGTSYLEALRVAARKAPGLYREILLFCLDRYEVDKASYHVSADLARVRRPDDLSEIEREQEYLDKDDGRQVLHVTFGSVLTQGATAKGVPFKDAILEVLDAHRELHYDLLEAHLGRHVELLLAG